ncbi:MULTISPECIES: YozE family protein [unclassified Virgibacillus]|uniref:YozE family protein n=1 Tax=unclassified Virgibacillus TaxID=2620237 RepID=UPI0024DEC9F8|nr:YozE family protein [Virgibacillus sp. LDC-1]
MRSFYHFMMTYRGKKHPDDESRLADWMFHDHNFPKQATSYDEISAYLELYSPFVNAIPTFDSLWDTYITKEAD